MKVLDVTGGVAQIDADGDNVADGDSVLVALGINLAERTRLATLFLPGATFSRVETTRLRIIDLNYSAYVLGVNPAVEVLPGCVAKWRDIIRCDIQRSRESVGVAGTPLTLNYTSANTEGGADRTLSIPLTGATLPAELGDVRLEVRVAGQVFKQTFAPLPNQTFTFAWDGKDAYGRTVQGTQHATVRVGYSFPVRWQVAAEAAKSFGLTCSAASTQACELPQQGVSQQRGYAYRWQRLETSIGGFDAKALGLGGFMVDAQNVYDPARQLLYTGDGRMRVGQAIVSSIKSVIGTGSATFSGLNGLASKAGFPNPVAMATGPDGSIYVASSNTSDAGLARRVFRVRPDGALVPFAGNGASSTAHFSWQTVPGEEGPALDAVISQPRWLDVGADGSVYIVDGGAWSARVLRVTPDGILHRVAGGPNRGVPMTAGAKAPWVNLTSPLAVAVGRDGAVYFTASGADIMRRVWRVGTDSTLSVVAGNGTVGYGVGDGGPATRAGLNVPLDIEVGPDGSLYFTDETRVRRVTPDGILHTVAGNGGNTYSTQGVPATSSAIPFLRSVSVAQDGTLYIANDQEVFVVAPNGIINTLAGYRFAGVAADGGPARTARFASVTQIALTPTNELLIVDVGHHEVRRIAAPLPGVSLAGYAIASEDGRELYGFDATGRHLVTRSALTGATLLTYGYDAAGRLILITDANAQVTRIERDATGTATAIIAPTGQRTGIAVGATSLAVTGPDGVPRRYVFDAAGLMVAMTDENNNTTQYGYDGRGLAITTTASNGGTAGVASTAAANGTQATLTSATGNFESIVSTLLPTGSTQLQASTGSASEWTSTSNPDGSTTLRHRNGTVVTSTVAADPVTGMLAALRSTTITLPSGLQSSVRKAAVVVRDEFDDVVTRIDSTIVNGAVASSVFERVAGKATIKLASGREHVVMTGPEGNVVRDSVPGLVATAVTYDTAGRVENVTQGGRNWQYAYDASGRVSRRIDAEGREWLFGYGAGDRPVVEISPAGDTTRVSYDAAGNVAAFVTPTGQTHGFTYNSLNLAASYTAPNVGDGALPLRARYDLDGRAVEVVRHSGDTVTMQYDSLGRAVAKRTRDGQSAIHYDVITGQLSQRDSWNGNSLRLTWNGFLQTRSTWLGAVTGSVSVTHNTNLALASESVNDASQIMFGYNADRLLVSAGALAITRSTGSGAPVSTTVGGVTTSYSYDQIGTQSGVAVSFAGSNVFSQRYRTDSLNRIESLIETIGTAADSLAYVYDAAGRLASVSRNGNIEASYQYDRNGNRTRSVGSSGNTVATFDAQDRASNLASIAFGYTRDGERYFRASAADTTWYRYSADGELLTVRLATGPTIDYVLDPLGRRIGKRVDGVLVRRWLYRDALSPAAELDGQGNIVSRFIYATNDNVPDYMLRGGRTYSLITDQVGTVRLIVDVATGAIEQRIDYDAFGRVVANTQAGFQPFGFAGGLYDELTGLVHFGVRDYDPETAQWTTRDPLLFHGGSPNLYAYAGADPVNISDPTGLYTIAELSVGQDQSQKMDAATKGNIMTKLNSMRNATCNLASKTAKQRYFLGKSHWHHLRPVGIGGTNDAANLLRVEALWHITDLHPLIDIALRINGMQPLRFDVYWDAASEEHMRNATRVVLKATQAFDAQCMTRIPTYEPIAPHLADFMRSLGLDP